MPGKVKFCYFLVCFLFISACQKEVQIAWENEKVLGTTAKDLLSAEKYTGLKLEITYMPGLAPSSAVIGHLLAFLQRHLHKPDGIQIILHPIARSNKHNLNIDDLVRIEKTSRSAFTAGKQIAVHIILADAFFMDPEVLATSYWNTSFCLFGKSIKERSGGTGQVSVDNLLTTLMEHEFGHLLGLVNQGSPMLAAHHDLENGAHCTNPDCLMYYAIETAENRRNPAAIPELDAACKADLKGNGGR